MKTTAMKAFMLMAFTVLVGTMVACGPSKSGQQKDKTFPPLTPETEKLLSALKAISSKGIMFGHHDDTNYGIGWEGDEGRSDVKSVCGDYPAVISFDLGGIEQKDTMNLDKVPFSKIKKEILNQYQRGGMVTLSWHLRNPKTGGDAWDVADTTVVKSILPGGVDHDKFAGWLTDVAGFINSLKTKAGTKIPVLFRPWHEHTGSWFWWGAKLCTPDQYKTLWRMTVDSLRAKGVDNVLYAYSTGTEPQDTTQYLQRYPGDDLIDVIGFDNYQFERDDFLASMQRELMIIDSIGKTHHKIIALTEAGYEGIPDPEWWTKTLLPAVEKYPIAYLLVWRNAREKPTHFFAPYPGQASVEDFVKFYRNPKTLFAADVNLYK